jgi:hypothetical protein
MADHDTRLRFRLFVAGEMVRETWIDAASTGGQRSGLITAADHITLRNKAEADGQPWMVEVFDPAAEDGYLRFGTDPSLMTDPRPLAGWWVEPHDD